MSSYLESSDYKNYLVALNNLSNCMQQTYNEVEDRIVSKSIYLKPNLQNHCKEARQNVIDLRDKIKKDYNL